MYSDIINSFIFPKYTGISASNAVHYLAFPLEVAKRKRSCGYKILVTINGNTQEYISLNEAAHKTGISTFTLNNHMKNGKTYYRRSNGDKIQVKRVKNV